MDSLITAAALALAARDPLGALLAISDPHASVAVDVAALKANPRVPGAFLVTGLVIDERGDPGVELLPARTLPRVRHDSVQCQPASMLDGQAGVVVASRLAPVITS
jgi:hypothetical protein